MKNRVKLNIAYSTRLLFSAIGLIFALVFTIRGIYQVVHTVVIHFNDIRNTKHWSNILDTLRQSPGMGFDTILLILCGLIMFHGIIGVWYAISTDYNITKMFRQKACFYLQILSAFAAGFVVMGLTRPVSEITEHSSGVVLPSIFSCVVIFLIALAGAFHISNGFYNACITLGISVAERAKSNVKIVSWIIAVFSMIQIVFLLL